MNWTDDMGWMVKIISSEYSYNKKQGRAEEEMDLIFQLFLHSFRIIIMYEVL